jgi:hypothetical protein
MPWAQQELSEICILPELGLIDKLAPLHTPDHTVSTTL